MSLWSLVAISLSSTRVRSVVTEYYYCLESVQSLRKDEAGNKTSKERVLSTLLVIGPSFGESCEIKADWLFLCSSLSSLVFPNVAVSSVDVKDVRSVRHETDLFDSTHLCPGHGFFTPVDVWTVEAFAGWDHFRHNLNDVRFRCAQSPKGPCESRATVLHGWMFGLSGPETAHISTRCVSWEIEYCWLYSCREFERQLNFREVNSRGSNELVHRWGRQQFRRS